MNETYESRVESHVNDIAALVGFKGETLKILKRGIRESANRNFLSLLSNKVDAGQGADRLDTDRLMPAPEPAKKKNIWIQFSKAYRVYIKSDEAPREEIPRDATEISQAASKLYHSLVVNNNKHSPETVAARQAFIDKWLPDSD